MIRHATPAPRLGRPPVEHLLDEHLLDEYTFVLPEVGNITLQSELNVRETHGLWNTVLQWECFTWNTNTCSTNTCSLALVSSLYTLVSTIDAFPLRTGDALRGVYAPILGVLGHSGGAIFTAKKSARMKVGLFGQNSLKKEQNRLDK